MRWIGAKKAPIPLANQDNMLHQSAIASPADVAVRSKQAWLLFVYLGAVALTASGYIAYLQTYAHLFEKMTEGSEAIFIKPSLVATPAFALLLLAASLVFEAALEIPTGLYADRRGPQFAIKSSFCIFAVHSILYLITALGIENIIPLNKETILTIIVFAEMMLCFGTAMQSGALNTWFIQSYRATGYAGPLTSLMAKRRLVTNCTWMVVGAFVLMLRELPMWIPFLVAFLSYFAGGMVSFGFMKPVQRAKSDPTIVAKVEDISFKSAWTEIRHSAPLRYILISHSAFWSLGLTLAYFWQRLVEYFHGGDMSAARNELALSLTWILISISRIAASAISSNLDALLKKGGRRAVYFLSQLVLALPIIFIGSLALLSPPKGSFWALAFGSVALAVSRFGQEIAKPISSAWIHEAIKSEENRTTIESVFEAVSGLGVSLVALIVLVASYYSPNKESGEGFLLVASAITASGVILIALWQYQNPPHVDNPLPPG
jgi:hypothetical protein